MYSENGHAILVLSLIKEIDKILFALRSLFYRIEPTWQMQFFYFISPNEVLSLFISLLQIEMALSTSIITFT